MSERNFIDINKSAAARTRMMLGQKKTDRLAPDQRERLEELVKDIDESIDNLVKEKAQLAKDELKSDIKSQMSNQLSKLPDEPNLFALEYDTKQKLERIDSRLRQRNPAAQDAI